MPTEIRFVRITKREVENSAFVLFCKVTNGLFNMVLDKAGLIFVIFIEYFATEQAQGGNEGAGA